MIQLRSHSLSTLQQRNQKRSFRTTTCIKAQSQEEEIKKTQRRGQATKKTGKQLRDEYFLAAQTGQERGLPEGAFLNDNTTGEEPQVELTFEPYGDKCHASQVLLFSKLVSDCLYVGIEYTESRSGSWSLYNQSYVLFNRSM